MQRFLNVSETPFDLRYDADEVIDIEAPTCRASNYGHAARAQAERLNNFPGNAHFFLRLGGERDADCVPNAFVQKNAKADRGLNCSAERSPCLCTTAMEWIINFLSKQAISGNGALHVRSFKRNDDIGEVQVLENPNVPQRRFNHRFRRSCAVLLQKIFFQRAAINADANRNFLRLRRADNFHDALVLPNVSGIQTQLINPSFQCQQGEFVMKVYVGNDWHVRHSFTNFLETNRGVIVRYRQAHYLATGA